MALQDTTEAFWIVCHTFVTYTPRHQSDLLSTFLSFIPFVLFCFTFPRRSDLKKKDLFAPHFLHAVFYGVVLYEYQEGRVEVSDSDLLL